MSDRDTITLPREAVEKIHEAWGSEVYPPAASMEWYDIMDALRTALAAEQPKHPGYVIGSHWLETAYSRICAGEAEARVLRDYGSVSVGEAEALQRENEALRRDAERLKDAMRKAMAMLDKHEPEPAGAFAVLLLALNPELQSAKNAALRREET